MPKLVAQHHVSNVKALRASQQRRSQGPRLHRGLVGHAGPVQVVVEPQRPDSQLLATQCAMQHVLIRERHMGHVHADVEAAHERNSNRPWLIVLTPWHVASNATELSLMP